MSSYETAVRAGEVSCLGIIDSARIDMPGTVAVGV